MDLAKHRALVDLLVGLVPADGAPIGNQGLRERFVEAARAAGHKVNPAAFDVGRAQIEELMNNHLDMTVRLRRESLRP